MRKFIIMTPSIIRPKLHNISIKKFYEEFYLKHKDFIDLHYEIYHIINIDAPDNLKQYSNQEETLNNYNEIIPSNIKKYFIVTENPKFVRAYKNILQKIRDLNLLSENNIYWWFEDDWKIVNSNINFFEFIYNTSKFNNLAYTMVQNSPLGSFRAGPLMNGTFFLNYFDLVGLNLIVEYRDPEKQFSKYITGNQYFASDKRRKIAVRTISKDCDKLINIILIYTSKKRIIPDFYQQYYTDNYSKDIQVKCHFVVVENNNFSDILYQEYNFKSNIVDDDKYIKCSFDFIVNNLNSDSITYIITKPFIFEDCGRGMDI